MTMGHSRVPVYAGEKTNIIGLVLVSFLPFEMLLVDAQDCRLLVLLLNDNVHY